MINLRHTALLRSLAIFLGLAAGCGPGGGSAPDPRVPGADPLDFSARAVDSAKKSESGANMKNGETKSVETAYGPVIVKKDQSGDVTYELVQQSKQSRRFNVGDKERLFQGKVKN